MGGTRQLPAECRIAFALNGTRSVPSTLVHHRLRIADANDTAADAVASVSGRRLRFEIVWLRMDNERAADDRMRAAELYHRVGALVSSVTLAIGFKIAQVADMTLH